jgi:hypothetical protein
MNNIRKVSVAFTGLLALTSAFVATPAFADGECLAWNVSGTWRVHQSNGTDVLLRLQQNDRILSGVGEYSYFDNDSDKEKTISGPIDGQLDQGFRVWVTTYWSNGSVGQYVGEIQADGGMKGYTHERADVNNKASITASGSPQCVTRAAPPPPPPPAKPTVAFARVQTTGPMPAICDAAKSARARNSPAAPGLERQCAAQGGMQSPALTAATESVSDHGVIAALHQPPPAVAPAPLPPFDPAVLDTLAATGADIAQIDPTVAEARNAEAGAFYQLGFDIATAIFGDPALGAQGNTMMGPGSERIRDTLSATGQRGFDASVKFHLARDYRH